MTEFLLLLTAAVLHEVGHILCAALSGIPLSGFALRPCGAVMTFDFSRTTYFRELCVHLAGPAAGILSAVFSLAVFGETAEYFAGLSVCLAVLNLLPVRGLDGSAALYCLLALWLPPETAETVVRTVSAVTGLLLWAAVLWIELRVRAGISLLLFSVYLMILLC